MKKLASHRFTTVAARCFSRRWLVAAAVLASSFGPPASAADDATQLALGKQLFTKAAVPACALCHTLKAAGSEGAVGPVLDEIKPDAHRVATALRNGIGQMPSYKASLSDAQIDALAVKRQDVMS